MDSAGAGKSKCLARDSCVHVAQVQAPAISWIAGLSRVVRCFHQREPLNLQVDFEDERARWLAQIGTVPGFSNRLNESWSHRDHRAIVEARIICLVQGITA